MSQYRLAKGISVPPRRINEVVYGKRSVTADTALRLTRYFGATEAFWMNLQARYALEVQRDVLGNALECSAMVPFWSARSWNLTNCCSRRDPLSCQLLREHYRARKY